MFIHTRTYTFYLIHYSSIRIITFCKTESKCETMWNPLRLGFTQKHTNALWPCTNYYLVITIIPISFILHSKFYLCPITGLGRQKQVEMPGPENYREWPPISFWLCLQFATYLYHIILISAISLSHVADLMFL